MGSPRLSRSTSKDPFSGHLFAFRGKSARKLKILFWDGNGLAAGSGCFIWPRMSDPGGTVTLSPAQLAVLIDHAC